MIIYFNFLSSKPHHDKSAVPHSALTHVALYVHNWTSAGSGIGNNVWCSLSHGQRLLPATHNGSTKGSMEEEEEEVWHSISASLHFVQYMPFSRCKDFCRFLPAIIVDESKTEMDPWYQFSKAIDDFNEIRRSRVVCSQWIFADESMSAWRPQTTALGGLPNIYHFWFINLNLYVS